MRSRGGLNYFRPDPLRLFVDMNLPKSARPRISLRGKTRPASLHVSQVDKGGYVRGIFLSRPFRKKSLKMREWILRYELWRTAHAGASSL